MKRSFPHLLFFLLAYIMAANNLFAQGRNITGTVTDSDGEPLIGVNIVIRGTSVGTITDINGGYSLSVSDIDILVFSYVGHLSKEVRVGDQTVINVILQEDVTSLDEIVVVGYGSKRKSDIVGAVATVSTTGLATKPSTDLQGMLKGQVAGLYVTVGTARPGGSSNILLRGINSLNASTSPLYVVDGFPVSAINEINIEDVETISILKDASAQAIYGARASNGVILITTRRGADLKGKTKVIYDAYMSVQNVRPNFELFSAEDYIQLRREMFRADNARASNGWIGEYLPDENIFTPTEKQNIEEGIFVDWLDLAFKKNAPLYKHDLTIYGGTEDTKYSASLGYFYQDGVRYSSDYERYSGKLTLDHKISNWLSTGLSVYYTRFMQHQETSLWRDFITFSPIARLYDDNGELNLYPLGDFKSVNPLWWEQTRSYEYFGNRGIYNGYLQITPVPVPGLKYRLTASMDIRNREADTFMAIDDPSNVQGKGYAKANFYNTGNYLVENILTYEKAIGEKHRFDLTLMQGTDIRKISSTSGIATELGNDFFGINSLGSAVESVVEREAEERRMLSYMGRINYIYGNRYLVNFTMRADGSSVFGANNKWGYFPSVAFAWNLHNESFMQNLPFITETKVRFSTGQIGNEAISPYGSLATAEKTFYVNNGESIVGYLPGSILPNPNLKWETSNTMNFGLDFSLFSRRLYGTVELYKRTTTDLLVRRSIPAGLGYTEIPDNLGEIENRGLELSLNGYPVSIGDFSWMIGGNFSMNKNELTKGVLIDLETGEFVDDLANRWFIGEPINIYFDYRFDGIWQIEDDIANSHQPAARPGDVKVADVSGPDGVPDTAITADDRVLIYRDPKFIASFNTSLKFKGFELSADVYAIKGVIRRNMFMYDFNHGGSLSGVLNGIKRDYWTPENPVNDCFRPHNDVTSEYRGTLAYKDASYVRLTNVTLAYTLPEKWVKKAGLSRARIYMRGDNLLTFTKFLSVSPEMSADSYPETVNYTFGMNIHF